MSLRKSTGMGGYYRVHAWHDADLNFHAEAAKVDGEWFAEAGTASKMCRVYQDVVDWVMDRYRLAKAGLESWDSRAAELAGNDGKDWEYLSDDEQRDYIDAASANARVEDSL